MISRSLRGPVTRQAGRPITDHPAAMLVAAAWAPGSHDGLARTRRQRVVRDAASPGRGCRTGGGGPGL